MKKTRKTPNKISDLAGTWKMDDKETEEFLGNLRKKWGSRGKKHKKKPF